MYVLFALLLAFGASPATMGFAQATAREERPAEMTESVHALLEAHDAVTKRYPLRKVGNIRVEPLEESYRVLLVDLPQSGEERETPSAVQVTVDRRTGKAAEVEEVEIPASPYSTTPVPASVLTGKQAFDIGFAALQGFDAYGKEGELSVELHDETYRVTFPLPEVQEGAMQADYAIQVWVDWQTGKVVKILASS